MKRLSFLVSMILISLMVGSVFLASQSPSVVDACGGLFCQNVPVDQQGERIIFAVNNDETISAYVQINYTGSAPDFSWVVPVPSVPELDVAEVDTFDELSRLTVPTFIPPEEVPDCAMVVLGAVDEGGSVEMSADGVEVLASGSVGPYNYDVITSPDPDALIIWLRDNDYRITEEMEPLVHVYTDEGMVFLAMKLKGEAGVQDIQPVVMTYESTKPMIPLRLTAVAANPNMTVLTWIFADEPAYPVNYANPTIPDEDIRISVPFSGPYTANAFNTNYVFLVDAKVDEFGGKAFITEFSGSANSLKNGVTDPLLLELVSDYEYVTRFFGRISPEEMTVDPIFDFDADLPDVSNIHDLSKFDPEVVYGCQG